jgi:hypothetical protein
MSFKMKILYVSGLETIALVDEDSHHISQMIDDIIAYKKNWFCFGKNLFNLNNIVSIQFEEII